MSYYEKWSDESKKKRREYDKINYSVIGCKLPRPVADAFRSYCADQGKSVSSVLADFVRQTLASSDGTGESLTHAENLTEEKNLPGQGEEPQEGQKTGD